MSEGAEEPFERRVVVAADAAALTAAASGHLRRGIVEAIGARGACWIALAGGRTPRAVYEQLAEAGTPAIDWTRVHVAFGDERVVPPDHADSNYGMAKAALLDRVPMPPHRSIASRASGATRPAPPMPTPRSCRGPSCSRRAPGPCWISCCWASAPTATPRRCSRARPRCPSPIAWPPRRSRRRPPTARVTLTYPVLNAARAVVVLVSGADKAGAVARAFDDAVPVADCPVRGVRPAAGSLTWHLDAAAASKLADALVR